MFAKPEVLKYVTGSAFAIWYSIAACEASIVFYQDQLRVDHRAKSAYLNVPKSSRVRKKQNREYCANCEEIPWYRSYQQS